MFDLFNEADKPFTGEAFTGPTAGLLPTAGQGLMRGGVKLMQAAALGVAPLFPSETDEEFERKRQQAPDQRSSDGLRQEDFYRFIEERLDPAVKFWSPDPASLTTAGQIVGALGELPLQLAAGPAGLIASPALTVGKELSEQGVDPTTATVAAVGTGAAMGLAVALPAAGQTLKQTLGLMVANPVIGAAQDAATGAYLKSQGYGDQAQMFDPFDPAARSVDAVLGAVFGGLAHYGRVKAQLPQQVADAIDTIEAHKQRDNLSPFVAAYSKEHRAAIQKGLQDLAEGKPVDVSAVIGATAPKIKEPSYTAARFRDDVQATFGASDSEATALLALVEARAKVRGEDVDSFIGRNIARVVEGAPEAAALYQDRPIVQPFYSKVLAEVEGLSQEKWSGEQLLGKLRKTPGVKAEEMAWTGLDEFLTGKQSVTRDEVRGFLEQNQVKLQEVVKGSPKKDAADLAIMKFRERGRHTGFMLGEVEDLEIDLWRGDLDPANAPRGMEEVSARLVTALRERDAAENEGLTRSKYDKQVLPGGENYRELLLTSPKKEEGFAEYLAAYRERFPEAKTVDAEVREFFDRGIRVPKTGRLDASPEKTVFRSSHFDEPNILAHIRYNERTSASGERVLHLEEVQSDWHQQGRSKGYQAEGGTIPDAPFKKTWHELALRRMLRYAAEHGFDRLTWTGGEAQAARYDLSKKIDKVTYQKEASGKYTVFAYPKEGQHIEQANMNAAEVSDFIGKELAEKITGSGKNSGSIEGVDLQVGGEGMRGFYDKMLPQFLDKFGRKFGAKVESAEVEGIGGQQSLPITDAMRDALLYEGQPLFQGEKGAVSFLADGRAVIHALQAPDMSTLVHELAHVFEKDLTPGERRQFDTWLLSQVPGAKWSTEQRELFARSFERYLAEGKAPTESLQGIFDQFKGWLLSIYQRITGSAIDVKMNAQIRQQFDRLLFTQAIRAEVRPELQPARAEVARVRQELEQDGRDLLGIEPEVDGLGAIIGRLSAEQESGALAGFLRSPENVGKALAEMFETEAAALEQSKAENLVVDGYQIESMISTAADWYLEGNRTLRDSGAAMDKTSVVNALRKTARGDFARLTAGQKQMVTGALDAISRQAQTLAREIDAQDLQVGDRFTTPELTQRVVVGERDGMAYLDDGTALDLAGTIRLLGEIDRRGRPDDMPQSAAEYYLQQQGDFQLYDGVDTEGNAKTRSAAETLHEARAELAKAEAQEHLYKRAAFCLNMG